MSQRPEQARAQRSRLRILEAALESFAAKGFDGTTFSELAKKADVSVGLACRYFPTKEHLALALYLRLAEDLEAWAAAELPEGTLAVRFEAAMRAKLRLVQPHRAALTALAARALHPEGRAAVFGAHTEVVRSTVSGVFALVVRGASDAPPEDRAETIGRCLYALHLLLVLLYVQDASEGTRSTFEALDLAKSALETVGPMLPLLVATPLATRVDNLFGEVLGTSRLASPSKKARVILERIFRRRRVLPGVAEEASEAAFSLHLPRVQAFIDASEPIELVLPAFPAKAPNSEKVLGKAPDAAEQLALTSLASLLSEIAEAHEPGARLVICSDGGVFADAVGVSDRDVATYRKKLKTMIEGLDLEPGRVRVFDLEDAFGAVGPTAARRLLMDRWSSDVEEIRDKAKRSPAFASLADGIHRFLFEDEVATNPKLSRTQARKATRDRAYEVVRRSEAWGRLVAAAFPGAIRLSIHPQPDVSEKIGVKLMDTEDAWLTPWHGVALLEGERYRLVRRSEAVALGARVVLEEGAPAYMEVGRGAD